MPPILILVGILLAIALPARKAKVVAKDAGVPKVLVTLSLGLAVHAAR